MNCCDVKRKKRSKSEMSFKFTIRFVILGWQVTSTGNFIQGMRMKISATLGITRRLCHRGELSTHEEPECNGLNLW